MIHSYLPRKIIYKQFGCNSKSLRKEKTYVVGYGPGKVNKTLKKIKIYGVIKK